MGAESGGGRERVVGIYWKAEREGKGGEAEGKARYRDKEKEIFAFDVELLQREA